MAEEKKQQYIGIKVLEDAQPMTVTQAKEVGLVKEDYEGETDGYKVTYADGYESWSPKTVFDDAYVKLTEADAKVINKLDRSPVAEIKLALKLRGHVNEIEKKQWSLKRLGSEVLKTYGVNLDEVNNDTEL